MLDARFVADSGEHLFQQRFVERGSHADGLRECGRFPVPADSVERFIPPIVSGDAEPFDGCGGMHHQRGLFLDAHLGDQLRRPVLGSGLFLAGESENEKRGAEQNSWESEVQGHGQWFFQIY